MFQIKLHLNLQYLINRGHKIFLAAKSQLNILLNIPTFLMTGFLEGILVFALTAILNTGVHAILDKRGYEVFNNEEMISLGVLFGVY